jgi:hypothetical protein
MMRERSPVMQLGSRMSALRSPVMQFLSGGIRERPDVMARPPGMP